MVQFGRCYLRRRRTEAVGREEHASVDVAQVVVFHDTRCPVDDVDRRLEGFSSEDGHLDQRLAGSDRNVHGLVGHRGIPGGVAVQLRHRQLNGIAEDGCAFVRRGRLGIPRAGHACAQHVHVVAQLLCADVVNIRPGCVCPGTAVQMLKRILVPDRPDLAAARGMRLRCGETGIDVRCVCHGAPCVIDEVSLRTAPRIKAAHPDEALLDPAEDVIQEGLHLGMPLNRFGGEMLKNS